MNSPGVPIIATSAIRNSAQDCLSHGHLSDDVEARPGRPERCEEAVATRGENRDRGQEQPKLYRARGNEEPDDDECDARQSGDDHLKRHAHVLGVPRLIGLTVRKVIDEGSDRTLEDAAPK